MSSHGSKWDTADEIMYLDQIGQRHESTRPISTAIMLSYYVAAAKQRSDWGSIDREKAVSYARRLLKDCHRRAAR